MCLGRHGAARVEGQAPHPSRGGQVRLARGTPWLAAAAREGADAYPQKFQKNQKNNLSNELVLCGTLSIVYGFVPAWIV